MLVLNGIGKEEQVLVLFFVFGEKYFPPTFAPSPIHILLSKYLNIIYNQPSSSGNVAGLLFATSNIIAVTGSTLDYIILTELLNSWMIKVKKKKMLISHQKNRQTSCKITLSIIKPVLKIVISYYTYVIE